MQVIRLDFHAVSGLVPVDIAAFPAPEGENIAFPGVGLGTQGLHDAAAVGGPVAGVHIQMQGTQAEGTMIS